MKTWPLATAKRAIVAGGCLGMAFTQLTTSPATVQFARSLGGSGLHIGILGALPVALVGAQLLAALAANHLPQRKPLWFWLSIVQRLVFLPAALGPWLFPHVPGGVWIWTLIALAAVNHGLLHFGTPLWLSWMGDYLPHQGLASFWGLRHSSQQWSAALALLVNAFCFYGAGLDVRAGFAAIIALGCALGVGDILLFVKVPEPPPRPAPNPRLWQVLAAPFRQRDFRSFIFYSCFWHLAAMVGAPFISMFLLEYVGMDLFHVLLLWTLSWVGGALLSQRLGQWVDRFGQRPVLILCTAFKSANMLALLACPRQPTLAFWLLAPAFMLDAFLNAGITIANNGYLLKNSPRENRTAFIAAGTAFAGLVGGATSIAAGAALEMTSQWTTSLHGWTIINFHVLFAVSVLLRLAAAVLATRVREPASQGTRLVVRELLVAGRRRVLRRLGRPPVAADPPRRQAA